MRLPFCIGLKFRAVAFITLVMFAGCDSHDMVTVEWDCNKNKALDFMETRPSNFGFVGTSRRLDDRRRRNLPIPVHGTPRQVLSADLNGDDRVDLASLNESGERAVSIVWSARSLAAEPVELHEGHSPLAAVAADFIEGGYLEIAVLFKTEDPTDSPTEMRPSLALLYWEDELVPPQYTHSQSDPYDYRLGSTLDDAYAMGAADYDSDGDVDLFITLKDVNGGMPYKVRLFENASEGSDDVFEPFRDISLTTGEFTGNIAAGDVDGDGYLELFIPALLVPGCTTGECIAVISPSPLGRWSPAMSLDMGEVHVQRVETADLNDDRRADLVVLVEHDDTVELQVLLNAHTGGVSLDNPPVFDEPVAYDMGEDVQDFLVADLNGDGYLDLVAVNGSEGEISVRTGMRDGRTFSNRQRYATGRDNNPRSVATLWHTSTSFPSLVVATAADSSLRILRNTTIAPMTPDCNRNRRPDSCDIDFYRSSRDVDDNGIPDECNGTKATD